MMRVRFTERLRSNIADVSGELTGDQWQSFSRAVSGEWEGVCCVFTGRGHLLEIPELYVPAAFREWDVTLYDWQTQASSTVREGTFTRMSKQLMPTAGCEADAVAFEEEIQEAGNTPGSGLAPLPDGGYSIGPTALDSSKKELAEHCVPVGDGYRVRVSQSLRNWTGAPGKWSVAEVKVFEEEFEGEYNAGTELFACGAGTRKLSDREALDAAKELAGDWVVAEGYPCTWAGAEGAGDAEEWLGGVRAGGEGVVMLPGGAWSRVTASEAGVMIEAGVMERGGSGRVVVWRRWYDGQGQLTGIAAARLTKG
ncbi:unnamed protein product [Pedinophyceae sp. YPF-701]|nr:unnamed protein product [Pedinophyceae sp. YPF-701]